MSERPNLLLLVVDALRADHVQPYGDRAETPAVASLARDGTTFRRAVSPAPWTLPSATSLLTGETPREHGATATGFESRSRTVVDDLSAAGYECVHVSPTTWIGDWLPQGRGFDRVEEFTGPTHRYFDDGADVRDLSEGVARGPEWYATVARRAVASDAPLRSLGNALAFKASEATGDAWLDDVRASESAAAALDDVLADRAGSDEPFFAYVHLMDPHLPLYVPEDFETEVRPPGCDDREDEHAWMDDLMDDVWAIRTGERKLSPEEVEFLRTRYADAVAYADSVVERMLDHLDSHGLADETVVAFTADHGEHLGERVRDATMLDHQQSVRLPVLRVPLVVRAAESVEEPTLESGERDDLVQTHHLAPTFRALAGLDHDRSRSLLAPPKERPGVAVATYDGVVRSHPPEGYATDEAFRPRTAAICGEWKLDALGDERRAARVDWAANEAETVPVDAVPDDVRESLAAALADAHPGAAAESGHGEGGPGSDPDDDGGRQSVPDAVGDRLEDLGYR